MYGEILLHLIGNATKNYHSFGSNCETIDIDITNGKVVDGRADVDIASFVLGWKDAVLPLITGGTWSALFAWRDSD